MNTDRLSYPHGIDEAALVAALSKAAKIERDRRERETAARESNYHFIMIGIFLVIPGIPIAALWGWGLEKWFHGTLSADPFLAGVFNFVNWTTIYAGSFLLACIFGVSSLACAFELIAATCRALWRVFAPSNRHQDLG